MLYGALGSDIVHSGPLSLMTIQRLMGNRQTFVLEPMPVPDTCTIALAVSNVAIVLVLDSLTEYLGLDLSLEPLGGQTPYERLVEKTRAGLSARS